MGRFLVCQLMVVVLGMMGVWAVSVSYAHQHEGGPDIIVVSPPEGEHVTTPFDLDVRFVARPDADVKADTLKIEVKTFMLGVDVTEQVKAFVTKKGIQLTNADFPRGHHIVTLYVADDKGRVGSKTVTMDVQ